MPRFLSQAQRDPQQFGILPATKPVRVHDGAMPRPALTREAVDAQQTGRLIAQYGRRKAFLRWRPQAPLYTERLYAWRIRLAMWRLETAVRWNRYERTRLKKILNHAAPPIERW